MATSTLSCLSINLKCIEPQLDTTRDLENLCSSSSAFSDESMYQIEDFAVKFIEWGDNVLKIKSFMQESKCLPMKKNGLSWFWLNKLEQLRCCSCSPRTFTQVRLISCRERQVSVVPSPVAVCVIADNFSKANTSPEIDIRLLSPFKLLYHQAMRLQQNLKEVEVEKRRYNQHDVQATPLQACSLQSQPESFIIIVQQPQTISLHPVTPKYYPRSDNTPFYPKCFQQGKMGKRFTKRYKLK
ncbi:hypothetical protein DAPPUDRAFT_119793 [Daphnia pulex]|uniref:Uncharacterized protein n=1 Tax=Daphnia pulex TaxID=6669 RepID=E9HZG7_DAPPU|nr:hypothetical protein DAPPUDRAFT_119793 [Daphnia pulex]|eukprot:EFX62864.1 hypothetical protein DAPPUDRAFT_119793 [Daphnia pulex]